MDSEAFAKGVDQTGQNHNPVNPPLKAGLESVIEAIIEDLAYS